MEARLIFEDWLARCSGLGHILTNLPEPITSDQHTELEELKKEKLTLKNAKGNTVRWTPTKQSRLDSLEQIRDGIDKLPVGAITYLEGVFRDMFWNRKELLFNKYLTKGTMCEEDSLDLLSKVDKVMYWKNDQHFSNDYIMGTPDLVNKLKDTKSNYTLDSYEKAELISLYRWQLKGYGWLVGEKKSELVYCLVNTPLHQLESAKKSLYFAMGMPEEDEKRWIEAVSQLERNHIFDIAAFRKENPHYDLMNERFEETDTGFVKLEWTYDIPSKFRIKRFPVELKDEDIEHIIRRVKMCRRWLCEKEKETLKLIAE